MIYVKKDTQKAITAHYVKVNGAIKTIRNGLVKKEGKWRYFLKYILINPVGNTLLDVDLFQLFGAKKNDYHVVFINNGLIGAKNANGSLLIKGFSTGSIITLINNGDIIGRGGNGNAYPNAGGNGGDAIVLHNNCTITNNGRIASGGGGGASTYGSYAAASASAAGGAGAGWLVGIGGAGAATLEKGTGGVWKQIYYAADMTSGAGGDLGHDGSLGSGTGARNSAVGKAGKAIANNATLSTFINQGTVIGTNELTL